MVHIFYSIIHGLKYNMGFCPECDNFDAKIFNEFTERALLSQAFEGRSPTVGGGCSSGYCCKV